MAQVHIGCRNKDMVRAGSVVLVASVELGPVLRMLRGGEPPTAREPLLVQVCGRLHLATWFYSCYLRT